MIDALLDIEGIKEAVVVNTENGDYLHFLVEPEKTGTLKTEIPKAIVLEKPSDFSKLKAKMKNKAGDKLHHVFYRENNDS